MHKRSVLTVFGLVLCGHEALASIVKAKVSFCSAFETTRDGQRSIQYNVEMDDVHKDSCPTICLNWNKRMKARGVTVGCHCDTNTGKLEAGFHMETDLLTKPPQAGFVSGMQTFQDVIEGSIEAASDGSIECLVQDSNSDINFGVVQSSLVEIDSLDTLSVVGLNSTEGTAESATDPSALRRRAVPRGKPLAKDFSVIIQEGAIFVAASVLDFAHRSPDGSIKGVPIQQFLEKTPTFEQIGLEIVNTIRDVAKGLSNLDSVQRNIRVAVESMPTTFIDFSYDTDVAGRKFNLKQQDW